MSECVYVSRNVCVVEVEEEVEEMEECGVVEWGGVVHFRRFEPRARQQNCSSYVLYFLFSFWFLVFEF